MHRSPEELHKDGLMWLLVVAVGFFFGFAWVTGPLGWHFANKLKAEALASGDGAVDDTIRFARIGGIVTTVITYAALVIIGVVLVAGLGFLAFGTAR